MHTVAEIMTREVLTIRPEKSVRELASLLAHARISGVPVVDESGTLVGVVSQTDVAAYASHALPTSRDPHGYYQGVWLGSPGELPVMGEALVADIMAPYAYFAHEETSLIELADLMLDRRIHRILVLRSGQVVGIVSSLDLIRALRDQLVVSSSED